MTNEHYIDEMFAPINHFYDYRISNYGRVISFKNKSNPFFLKQKSDKDGYMEVGLWENGIQRTFKVHQLVAKEFVDNPESKPQVNHIDFNRGNNKWTNLEWATPQEDANHRRRFGRIIKGDKHYSFGKFRGESKSAKIVIDLQTGVFYDCAKDAAEAKSIKYSTLKGYLNGNDNNPTSLVYA